MPTKFIKRAVSGMAAAVLLGGAAQAALLDRDLDKNGVTDAFYDTDLNITWLRDANVNGPMNWETAVSWADGFSFGGYTDWRLPTSDACFGYNCTGSELGHLWYFELGNSAHSPAPNTGAFQNMHTAVLWSGTEYSPSGAFYLYTYDGLQWVEYKVDKWYGLPVRPGDVAAVPEPHTYALMLLGLTGLLAVAMRQRPH